MFDQLYDITELSINAYHLDKNIEEISKNTTITILNVSGFVNNLNLLLNTTTITKFDNTPTKPSGCLNVGYLPNPVLQIDFNDVPCYSNMLPTTEMFAMFGYNYTFYNCLSINDHNFKQKNIDILSIL